MYPWRVDHQCANMTGLQNVLCSKLGKDGARILLQICLYWQKLLLWYSVNHVRLYNALCSELEKKGQTGGKSSFGAPAVAISL